MSDQTTNKSGQKETPRSELVGEDEKPKGKPLTIAERAAAAANGAHEQDLTQQQLFENGVLDGDPEITVNNLVGPNETVTTRVAMRGAQVPLRGGLIDPRSRVRVSALCQVSRYIKTPIGEWRDDDTRNIEEWKVSAELTPIFVEYLGTGEDAVMREFDRMLAAGNTSGAGRLLDNMRAKMEKVLAEGNGKGPLD
jgi:hypothetical protein